MAALSVPSTLAETVDSRPARVRVYNDNLFDTLCDPSDATEKGSPSKSAMSDDRQSRAGLTAALKKRTRMEKKKKLMDAEESRQRRYQRHREQSTRLQAESERQVRERLATVALNREEKHQRHRGQLALGDALVEEVGKQLALADLNQRNKVKRQFEEWNDNVYGKIQGNISETLNSMDYKELNARKRADYQKFLDATNTKGALFRDIIIESEYDPLEPNRNCIKSLPGRLHDPISRVIDKHYEETGMLEGGSSAARKPKVREVLDVLHWGTGKIEATPHGFFAKIMAQQKNAGANPGGATVEKRESKTYASHIPFDHYNVPMGKAITDTEFPVGKRTKPPPLPDDA